VNQAPTTDLASQLTAERIGQVAARLIGLVRRTPTITVDRSDFGLPAGPLTLKLEQLQHTGSFKVRGAFANLLLRTPPAAGVVAASGGNHGAAVAFAAQRLGIPARIYVPHTSSPTKVARIREYGADLVLHGQTYAEALAASQEWAETTGAQQVHAFDQVETILGASTLGLELRRQAPDAQVVLGAVGGGGLLAGIAAAYADTAQVIGVEPEAAPTLSQALQAGHPVDAPTGGIAVDSLAPRRVGQNTFAVLTAHAAQAMLVSDDDIRHAQHLVWDRLRLIIEPGGCAALAALTSTRWFPSPDQPIAVVLSGANTQPDVLNAHR